MKMGFFSFMFGGDGGSDTSTPCGKDKDKKESPCDNSKTSSCDNKKSSSPCDKNKPKPCPTASQCDKAKAPPSPVTKKKAPNSCESDKNNNSGCGACVSCGNEKCTCNTALVNHLKECCGLGKLPPLIEGCKPKTSTSCEDEATQTVDVCDKCGNEKCTCNIALMNHLKECCGLGKLPPLIEKCEDIPGYKEKFSKSKDSCGCPPKVDPCEKNDPPPKKECCPPPPKKECCPPPPKNDCCPPPPKNDCCPPPPEKECCPPPPKNNCCPQENDACPPQQITVFIFNGPPPPPNECCPPPKKDECCPPPKKDECCPPPKKDECLPPPKKDCSPKNDGCPPPPKKECCPCPPKPKEECCPPPPTNNCCPPPKKESCPPPPKQECPPPKDDCCTPPPKKECPPKNDGCPPPPKKDCCPPPPKKECPPKDNCLPPPKKKAPRQDGKCDCGCEEREKPKCPPMPETDCCDCRPLWMTCPPAFSKMYPVPPEDDDCQPPPNEDECCPPPEVEECPPPPPPPKLPRLDGKCNCGCQDIEKEKCPPMPNTDCCNCKPLWMTCPPFFSKMYPVPEGVEILPLSFGRRNNGGEGPDSMESCGDNVNQCCPPEPESGCQL